MPIRPFFIVFCIALLTFTVATSALPYALADAAIAVDPLFGIVLHVRVVPPDDVRLPAEPVVDVGAARAPPLAA